jgi:Family of unknown function (DUF6526)
MTNQPPLQTYKNHAKYVPLFHFVLLPLLGVNFVWTVVRLVKRPSADTLQPAILGASLLLLAFLARIFALRVQDRVIRLEMRLRLREVLPPDLVTRIREFQPRQLVALRFASDAELPVLARKVLDDKLSDQTTIKKMIRDWEADHLRA